MRYTEQWLRSHAHTGPLSDWEYEDGSPIERIGFYAGHDHWTFEGATLDEALEKLVTEFRKHGLIQEAPGIVSDHSTRTS